MTAIGGLFSQVEDFFARRVRFSRPNTPVPTESTLL
jgi:hypothetical protein